MSQLILSRTEVKSVFYLLGENKDNISYSVAWLLVKSKTILNILLTQLFGNINFEIENTVIYLQKTEGKNRKLAEITLRELEQKLIEYRDLYKDYS